MLEKNTKKAQRIIDCIMLYPMATAKEIAKFLNEKVSTVNIVRSRIGWKEHKNEFFNSMVMSGGLKANDWREKFNENYKIKEKNRYIKEKRLKALKKARKK